MGFASRTIYPKSLLWQVQFALIYSLSPFIQGPHGLFFTPGFAKYQNCVTRIRHSLQAIDFLRKPSVPFR